MCASSEFMDYGMHRIPVQQWTPDTWQMFQQIMQRLDEFDRKMNQPDCVDPAKKVWMQSIEERIRTLEVEKVTT